MSPSSSRHPLESVLALIALLLLVYWWWYPHPRLLGGIIILIFVALLWPAVAQAIDTSWQALTRALGWVSGKILMGLVFFILLTPLAWLYRLFSKNSFAAGQNNPSVFVDRHHTFGPNDLKNPW